MPASGEGGKAPGALRLITINLYLVFAVIIIIVYTVQRTRRHVVERERQRQLSGATSKPVAH